ncbi:hypothetical protein ABIE79_010059 [Bradyrhizobium diazoefficiens]
MVIEALIIMIGLIAIGGKIRDGIEYAANELIYRLDRVIDLLDQEEEGDE